MSQTTLIQGRRLGRAELEEIRPGTAVSVTPTPLALRLLRALARPPKERQESQAQ
jgi:hypothetical protein